MPSLHRSSLGTLQAILLGYISLLMVVSGETGESNSVKPLGKSSWTTALNEIKSRTLRSSGNQTTDDGNITEDNNYIDNGWDYSDLTSDLYLGPVCDIIEVRHTPEHLKDLENCTIVNGFVSILFMNDNANQSLNTHDLSKWKFPKLRVITEYLLIYRVYKLKSLKDMFPNLMLIKGHSLFSKYSLVIFENPDLTELGLKSLQYIERGTVRIENNGVLCYLSTINWPRLGKYFKNEDLKKRDIFDKNLCLNHCGEDNKCLSANADGIDSQYCWGVSEGGENLCQQHECPSQCPAACDLRPDAPNRCPCHEECLGGCSAPLNASQCYACKNVYHSGTCKATCPANTYLSLKWRCISKEDCMAWGHYTHENNCLMQCPQQHRGVEHNNTATCEKCNGSCFKNCTPPSPYLITTQYELLQLERCTIINAQLIITVTGADMVEKLEDALGELQQVDSIVIRHSSALVSLSFLRNLRNITGKENHLIVGDNGYSFYVVDNQNLKDLWDFEGKDGKSNLTIGGGKAFFHFNPSLCMDKIEKIEALTKAVEDATDISLSTNGNRISCVLKKIKNFTIRTYAQIGVGAVADLEWLKPKIKDPRTLIGYHIFYRKTKFENVTYYQGGETLENTEWSVMDVDRNEERNHTLVNTQLFHLTAYTKYACYVVTYTVQVATDGAQSKIEYFTTMPSQPSHPRSLELTATGPSSIVVSWKPPRLPNGNITHYIVRWKRQLDNREVVDTLDLCKYHNNIVFPQPDTPNPKPSTGTDQTDGQKDGTCTCEKNSPPKTESQVRDSQSFEDYLIDNVIFKTVDDNDWADHTDYNNFRKKRSISVPPFYRYKRNVSSNTTASYSTRTSALAVTTAPPVTPRTAKPEIKLMERLVNTTNFTVTGLYHFTEYYFEVIACNHAYKTLGCGGASIETRRTKKLDNADNIDGHIKYRSHIDPKTKSKVISLSWTPPAHPNAYITHYTIDYGRIAEAKTSICCSALQFNSNNHSCELPVIVSGKYQAWVTPVSLASKGNMSEPVSFEIEEKTSPTNSTIVVVAVVVATVFLIPLILLVVYLRKRYIQSKKPQIYASVNPEYSSIGVYEPDEYEISADEVELLREIGHGHFGKVYEGLAKNVIRGQDETQVAVKTLHGNETVSKRMEFLKEASVMKAFNAHHVVRLLGVVSMTNKPMVVMEFMEHGDLKTYLRATRPDAEDHKWDSPTLQQKLQMCGEIADGMAYLSERKFVHRDLAARNCLVHMDMTVKIGDFGLTRDVYETDYYRIDSRGILPVRWMAPESLKDGVFDSRSDVWSYGIVLWEIANLAEQPYQGQQHDQVTRFVIDGGYMEQPRECPQKLYDLMLMCWHYSPSMRPTFVEIVSSLSPDLSDKFKQVSFFHEQKECKEDAVAEEDAFLADSLRSSEGVFCTSGDIHSRGDLHPIRNSHGGELDNYRHLNGGHQNEQVGDGVELVSEKDDTVRYIPHPVQTHRHASTIC